MKNIVSESLWNQRDRLASSAGTLRRLYDLVGRPCDLDIGTWAQFYAIALHFKPDRIVEIGRGAGNSTCCFAQAANDLGDASVVSIDQYPGIWHESTEKRIEKHLGSDWLSNVDIRVVDAMKVDFEKLFCGSQRSLFFWDAHGTLLAEFILAKIMPLLASRQHIVIVHDIVDSRWQQYPTDYVDPTTGERNYRWSHFASPFDELWPLGDFVDRNCLRIQSAGQSIAGLLECHPDQQRELLDLWGPDLRDAGRTALSASAFVALNLTDRDASSAPLQFPPFTAIESIVRVGSASRWDQSRLIEHVRKLLVEAPGRRLLCYGIGRDFAELVKAGVFADQQVVGLLDDYRIPGERVAEWTIRHPSEMKTLQPDLILPTASGYIDALRERARGMLAALGFTADVG